MGGEVPAHDEVGGEAEGEDAVDPVGEEEMRRMKSMHGSAAFAQRDKWADPGR